MTGLLCAKPSSFVNWGDDSNWGRLSEMMWLMWLQLNEFLINIHPS